MMENNINVLFIDFEDGGYEHSHYVLIEGMSSLENGMSIQNLRRYLMRILYSANAVLTILEVDHYWRIM